MTPIITPIIPKPKVSFLGSVDVTIPVRLIFPKNKLPRKMKKAVKTLFFRESRHKIYAIHTNPVPRTRWERKVKAMCPPGTFMTPNGIKFTIHFQ